MKSTERFLRDMATRTADARVREEAAGRLTVAGLLVDTERAFTDVANILADHEKQAKARASAIEWILSDDSYVAKVGLLRAVFKDGAFRVHPRFGASCLYTAAADTPETAAKKIRAWRKAQRKGRAS